MLLAQGLLVSTAFAIIVSAIPSGNNVDGDDTKPDENAKYCSCSGPNCRCCVDFNITYIDLGGPGDNITTTCMDILLDLAQMCASFNEMARTENGIKACVSLEPTFLGDPQDSYHLGCFDMSPNGMSLMNKTSTMQYAEPNELEKPVNEESLIAAVNESAEEGIAWFSSFLGFNFGNKSTNLSSSNGQ